MKNKQELLNVTVVDAKLLYDLDAQKGQGKMDPFVVIQLGSQKKQTKVAMNKGKTPSWKESFELSYDQNNVNLKISVFDSDPSKKKKDELIGEGLLNVLNILNSPHWELALPLYKNKEDQGTLNLNFEFIGKQKPRQDSQMDESANSQQSKQQQQQQQSNKRRSTNPLTKPEIQFQSVDYKQQLEELDKQIQNIVNKEFHETLQYLNDEQITQAIEEGLKHVCEENPEDQIECLAQFLLDY